MASSHRASGFSSQRRGSPFFDGLKLRANVGLPVYSKSMLHVRALPVIVLLTFFSAWPSAAEEQKVVGSVGGQRVIHMGGGSPPVPIPSSRAQAVPAAATAEAELEQLRAAQQNSWSGINNLNPFSAEAGKKPAASVAVLPGPFEQLTQLLNQPAVQGYLKLFSNPTFSKGIDEVIKSPRRMTLLYAQIGFIVFMMFFRAWRFSKSTHWIKKLWTQLWTFGLFWIGAVVVIPWAILGDAYYNTIAGLLDVWLTKK